MADSPRSDTSVCDACSDFHHLLRNRKFYTLLNRRKTQILINIPFVIFTVEDHLHSVTEGYDGHEVLIIDKHKLDVFYQYLGIWVQRYGFKKCWINFKMMFLYIREYLRTVCIYLSANMYYGYLIYFRQSLETLKNIIICYV